MVPAFQDGCLGLVLRVSVPEHKSVNHGCVLYAIVGGTAFGEAAQIELLGILVSCFSATAELDPRNILACSLHVERDGAVPEQ